METVRIDQEKCSLCGLCIPVCVRRILEETDDTVVVTDPSRCILCGHCKAVCPEDAPQLPSLDAAEFIDAPLREEVPDEEVLLSFFRSRRSIRSFLNRFVEQEKLERIVEAGRFAPTGGNRQPLHFVVLHSADVIDNVRRMTLEALLAQGDRIEKAFEQSRVGGKAVPKSYQTRQLYPTIWREIAELNKQGKDRLFFHAPALIVCHLDPGAAVTPEVDPGLAAMQMLLMAEALGLGTCLCGFLVFALEESPQLREALKIPEDHYVPLSFMVGYPDVTFRKLVARNPARVHWM